MKSRYVSGTTLKLWRKNAISHKWGMDWNGTGIATDGLRGIG
jgi:hypothetical protein